MTMSVNNQQLTHPPIAKAEMLIRKPVADVFEAFIDPAITSKFWFTTGSGKLEPGSHVQWDWEMYDASVQVRVKDFEQNRRILIEWPADGTPTEVEWIFIPAKTTRRSSASRTPASVAMGMSLSNRRSMQRKGLRWCSRDSRRFSSTTSP